MVAIAAALAMGLLFGVGLIISGMTDPANVKGFLDVFGQWRPQLMAVLGVGMMVTWLLYVLARRMTRTLAGTQFHWPHSTAIDKPLVLGAALFGAGWALAGYCPGPALVAAGALNPVAMVFVVAMLAGGLIQRAMGK
ncbi:MAG: DUF6691 family protein [Betaproteobacteria bacterium]